MEARHARRTKTVRRAARRKEFVGAVTDCDGTTPTEAQYEARRKELMKECEIPPQLYEQVDERLKIFLKPFLQTFVRREQHDHAATYVSGLLSELEHKNAEAIAYLHGQDRLGLQRFLGWAEWDDAPLRMELARQIGRELGEADGVLVFDPSGFAKSGRESVGVARQWCGRLGKVENCQVAVYLGYVSGQEHALVDMRLYLPQEWTRDKARCKKAGVPTKQRRHRTRHQLCLEMLAEKGGFLPHTWLAGDDELGRVFWFCAASQAARTLFVGGPLEHADSRFGSRATGLPRSWATPAATVAAGRPLAGAARRGSLDRSRRARRFQGALDRGDSQTPRGGADPEASGGA